MPRFKLPTLAGRIIRWSRGMNRPSSLLVGTVSPSSVPHAVKVVVTRQIFNDRLRLFYPEKESIYAVDGASSCKTGDIVLIKELPERPAEKITHEIQEVLYPCGDVTDPVTGEKVVGSQYRFLLDLEDDLIRQTIKPSSGETSFFDHKTAPARGSTKLDKTDREVYIRYDARIDDDYAVDEKYPRS